MKDHLREFFSLCDYCFVSFCSVLNLKQDNVVSNAKQKIKNLYRTAQTTNLRIRGWRTKEGIRGEALLI